MLLNRQSDISRDSMYARNETLFRFYPSKYNTDKYTYITEYIMVNKKGGAVGIDGYTAQGKNLKLSLCSGAENQIFKIEPSIKGEKIIIEGNICMNNIENMKTLMIKNNKLI